MPGLSLAYEHTWPQSVAEARCLQEQLAGKVILTDAFAGCDTVAGIDIGFEDGGATTKAAAVLLSFPGLETLESALIRRPTSFPYVPGYLSFREVPGALQALERLTRLPDLILCDGQGYAHPRRFGLACHLGVLTNIPTIGVAKTRLIGTHAELSGARGSWQPLIDQSERIGAVLRTRADTRPLYISSGHRISLETALARVLACTTRFRQPETTRRAHHLASVATAS